MGCRSRIAALTAIWFCSACGDPFVVIGDSPGTFRIVAGIPDSAGAAVGATAVETTLNGPLGLAAASDGVLFIADHGNARVLTVASSGTVRVALTAGTHPGTQSLAPEGLAGDAAGRLLIADPGSHRIWRLDPPTGSLEALAGNGARGAGPDTVEATATPLDAPTGIAVGLDGAVYFSELSAHRIRRLEPSGRLTTFAGIGSPGFTGDGGPAVEARLRGPAGLALADGVLYVADSGNHRVRAIDLSSERIETLAGSGVAGFAGDDGPAVDAMLNRPRSVAATTGLPTVYIADTENHRVRAVDLSSGRIASFAGSGDPAFVGDLLAIGETGLSQPGGLGLSPLGLLHVSDTGHHIVRRTAVTSLVAP